MTSSADIPFLTAFAAQPMISAVRAVRQATAAAGPPNGPLVVPAAAACPSVRLATTSLGRTRASASPLPPKT